MGAAAGGKGCSARENMICKQAKGQGYAVSTEGELKVIAEVAA